MTPNANMRRQAVEHPYQTILLVVLYAAGAASLPIEQVVGLFTEYTPMVEVYSIAVARFLCCILPVILINDFGYNSIYKGNGIGFLKTFLWVLPCFLIAVNNLPLVAVWSGGAEFVDSGVLKTVGYVLTCFGISALEELEFRGCVLGILREKFGNGKKGDFLSVLISSAVFGGLHVINLFGSWNFGAVILQIGYSFLIGAMCAFIMIKTNNIFLAITAHAIYDVGGLMYDFDMVAGNIWNVQSVVFTAVLGVTVALIITYFLCWDLIKDKIKSKKQRL